MTKEIESHEQENSNRGFRVRTSLVRSILRNALVHSTSENTSRTKYSVPFSTTAHVITIRNSRGQERSYFGRITDLKRENHPSTIPTAHKGLVDLVNSKGKVLGQVNVEVIGDKMRILEEGEPA